ncbi:hypothetical protein J2Z49_001386 [Desulfofundulus luciae]|uniref:Uncharacterized protein n=1 Tax=Desulfofundulus luciae TaxID=74702 RepID=A0ABU0B0N5_9FIRM|nr:hypothetical protein [Desulfofundulus luciae]
MKDPPGKKRRCLSGPPAKDTNVHQGVPAQAVPALHSSRHLAGRKKAGYICSPFRINSPNITPLHEYK